MSPTCSPSISTTRRIWPLLTSIVRPSLAGTKTSLMTLTIANVRPQCYLFALFLHSSCVFHEHFAIYIQGQLALGLSLLRAIIERLRWHLRLQRARL